ncbi:MAG: hypothetical protein AAFX50_21750, partial [Acidobacteriota bacterium]
MYAFPKDPSPPPRAERTGRVLLCALTLCGLGLAAAPSAAAVDDEPAAAIITVGEPRFEDVAEALIRELDLLGVDARKGPADAEPGCALDVEGCALGILVGAAHDAASLAGPAQADLVVDPVGWPADPATSGVDTVADSLEDTARIDFARLRGFLDAAEERRRELTIPLDAWLSAAEPTLRRAAESAGFTVRVVDPAELTAPGDGVLYLPPGSGAAVDVGETARRLTEAGAFGFSSRGRPDVEAGWLLGPAVDRRQRLVRRAALETLVRIRGVDRGPAPAKEPPSTGPDALAIHVGTAHALGLELPWRLRLEATVVGSTPRAEGLTVAEARG